MNSSGTCHISYICHIFLYSRNCGANTDTRTGHRGTQTRLASHDNTRTAPSAKLARPFNIDISIYSHQSWYPSLQPHTFLRKSNQLPPTVSCIKSSTQWSVIQVIYSLNCPPKAVLHNREAMQFTRSRKLQLFQETNHTCTHLSYPALLVRAS